MEFDLLSIPIINDLYSNPEIVWQTSTLIASFVLSFFSYKVTRKFFFPKLISYSLRRNVELNRIVTKYFIPMAFLCYTIAILSIVVIISPILFKNELIIHATLKLILLFTFLRFIRISSDSTFIANFVGIFLVPAYILDLAGYLPAVTTYLDSIALQLGEIRISVYITIKSTIVLIILFWFSSMVTTKSKSYINANKKIKSSNKVIIGKFIDIFIYCAVGIIILKTVGVQMTTLAVVGGAVGVGIGFGLQKIASNFISGIILLFERSIEVGDWIEIEGQNIFGIVKHFGGRYTLIECFDGQEIMVPNEDFIINRVNNWTFSNNRCRIEINFSVAYGTDLDKVVEIATAVAQSHERCLTYPEIECYVTQFGDNGIHFILFFWVSDITKGRYSVKSYAYIELAKRFAAYGIEIPYPKRDIYIKEQI